MSTFMNAPSALGTELCAGSSFAVAFVGLRADDLATAYATHAPRTGRSHSFAGQHGRLLHPIRELRFVELVVFAYVE
jgi:hypothetical protein